MPDEDRYTYAEVLSRGGYLATVSDVSGSQHKLEVDILDEEGSIDLDEHEESWRSGRWGGYDAGATEAYSLGADVGESDRRTAESASRSAMTGTTT